MSSRRSIVAGVLAVLGAVAAVAWVGVWRILPVSDPVTLTVENYDDDAHDVTVRVVDDGTEAFAETIRVPAAESGDGPARSVRVSRDEILERVGRYRVVAELADGTTDEYVLEPLDAPIWGTRMPDLVVVVEGELGRLRVVGTGGRP
ncbi:hypothetical protein BRC81_07165 [Halobacteriales archaeon QS_1_68_20]|nr:MAG: hypothetical protein BRC81_07165 [Halobacteriales archaeon QS_1_68_20]